jgi:hypothetical protein
MNPNIIEIPDVELEDSSHDLSEGGPIPHSVARTVAIIMPAYDEADYIRRLSAGRTPQRVPE